MKKNYIAPNVEITEIELQQLLAGSPEVTGKVGGSEAIGYGGIDENGTKDPAARRRRKDVWADEEEDDFGY